MQEKRYIISDASKMIDVADHVLRYWEKELEVDVPRNELDHRYYNEGHIELFKSVKALKDKGFQLKAIKLLLPEIKKVEALDATRLNQLRDKLEIAMGLDGVETKEKELDEDAISIKNEDDLKGEDKAVDQGETLEQEHGQHFDLVKKNSTYVEKNEEDKLGQFRNIMCNIMKGAMQESNEQLSVKISEKVTDSVIKELDYRLKVREEKEEERFKQLDRTIREYQLQRQQVAATKEVGSYKKKESKFFKKNKVRI